MRRRRTFLLIFAILILILIVGLIALWRSRGGGDLSSLLQPEPQVQVSETPRPEPTPEEETELIVVAVQTVPRGMPIPPDAVEIRAWAKSKIPKNTVRELESVVGRVARVDIHRQSAVLKSDIAEITLGAGAEMALEIPKGKVAYAMPVRILSAVANAVRPGDRVDVLLSFSLVEVHQDTQLKLPVIRAGEGCLADCQETGTQIPRLVSQYSVQNATVLDVGLWKADLPALPIPTATPVADEIPTEEEPTPVPSAPSPAQAATQLTSITLVVSPQDALVLKWAWETDASIDLVMRSAVDQDIYAQPESVTLQYMLDRFQISVPPKLPHSPENNFQSQTLEKAQQTAPTGGE
jgi:Flp pilus assembly protein CpaB